MESQIKKPNADALAQAVQDLQFLNDESDYEHPTVLTIQQEQDSRNEKQDAIIHHQISRKHRRLWKELKRHLYNPDHYQPKVLTREEKKAIAALFKMITDTTSNNFERIALLSNTLFGLPDTNTLLSEYPPYVRMCKEARMRVYAYGVLSMKYYEVVIR